MDDNKVINLEKRRNAMILNKIFRILRIPLALLLIAAILFVSARAMGDVAMSNVTDSFNQVKYIFTKGEGYPHSLDTFNFRKITSAGAAPIVVYDDSLAVLNSSAEELLAIQPLKTDVKVASKNGRALIYSPSSNDVTLISKTEELGSVAEEGAVITAALAKNGSIATSHSTEKHQSVLKVYNSRFKNVFQWNCSQERIADISLSNNGKNLVVAAIGAENAEIYTRLLIFNVGSSEPLADVRYSGTMLLKVVYTASNKIIAVGDNKTVVLNKKGEAVDELIYSEDSILAVCADVSGNVVVCYEEFGGSKTCIVRYSRSGRQTCSFTVDGIPDCVAAQGSRIAVSAGNEIVVYSSGGRESKRIETKNSPSQLVVCSGTVYAVEGGAIHKY